MAHFVALQEREHLRLALGAAVERRPQRRESVPTSGGYAGRTFDVVDAESERGVERLPVRRGT
jgi:hypothetical protein